MKRSLIALTLAASLAAPAAQACAVYHRLDPVAAGERADLIVRGRIIEYETVGGGKGGAVFHARMTVSVDETLKGSPVDEVIVVWVDNWGVSAKLPWRGAVTIGAHALEGEAVANFDAGFALIGGICSEPFVIE